MTGASGVRGPATLQADQVLVLCALQQLGQPFLLTWTGPQQQAWSTSTWMGERSALSLLSSCQGRWATFSARGTPSHDR